MAGYAPRIRSVETAQMARASKGGTALPTSNDCAVIGPSNWKESGKLCNRAASLIVIRRFWE